MLGIKAPFFSIIVATVVLAVFASPSNAASAKKQATSVKPKRADLPMDDSGDEDAMGTASANATLKPSELAEFSSLPSGVQRLLAQALALTQRGLTYRFGSADPASGGMDCSGTVQFMLRSAGIANVPRMASGMYLWAQNAGALRRVSVTRLDEPALQALRPGDLLFWEGTYAVRRDPPTSHVMIYLGIERATGKPVMVGASDGRSYRGKRRNGVSVFDFKLPGAGSSARFVGYASTAQLAGWR